MTEKGKRHTNIVNDLIDEIIKRRIKLGHSRLTLMEWLMKDKGYSKSRAYEYMEMTDKEINERSIKNFGDDLKPDIAKFEELYEVALKAGDKKEARECLKEISKLKGHYVERVNVQGIITGFEIKIINKQEEDDKEAEGE